MINNISILDRCSEASPADGVEAEDAAEENQRGFKFLSSEGTSGEKNQDMLPKRRMHQLQKSEASTEK